ncbi:MAG: alanine--tRNA ligase [Anaerovibrio sp.]|uniref:alanine--tRNA ligase n=1 Tax=Anaerovibrio sp. TaxID=1872532 RepID=UPI0025E36380|nr:alanine--tRNA ligase [Anaerovibrio sp.]MCR5175873.1 alanine--tRNA ligase [Anaerovibrio sp.]
MTGNELREAYLTFFAEKKGHLRLPSASLIPENDPTLLMIGAGMAPFKAYFTGKVKPPRPRITTSQRCVRTGDIENVGRTARHQTYFEMLGNFSFGDYFKKEAIPWAWEFLTEVLEMPKDKLWATIYPKDDEARKLWEAQPGFDPTHIVPLEDNFWEIGPGPCGPDTEIYFDLGEERGCGSPTCAVGCDCDRYLEIWNNVFTQFDRTEDGKYNDLENKNIDTGMGLERIASVIQGVPSNFETDLLFPIIEYASKVSGVKYGEDADKDVSLKVIADHARSMSIMIMDGILPSNEGRGYVLRRILRRAIRHGRMLGIKDKFLEGAVDAVCKIYEGASDFEALAQKQDYIKKVISLEEDRFSATLEQGMELLDGYMAEAKSAGKKVLDGALSFKLYDTFGFPWELTEEILQENDMELDKAAFDKEMQEQRDRARAARAENQRFAVPDLKNIDTAALRHDENATEAEVVAIWKDGVLVDSLQDGEEAGIILSNTPFYAEGGGQVGDTGMFISELGRIKATNAKKLPDGTIYHESYVEEGQLKVGDTVKIKLDKVEKLSSARNHTATHLLQAALKKVVGDQINQAGSSVNGDRLRFDFTNFEPVSPQQLADVEELVNNEILKGTDVVVEEMSKDAAVEKGAMALFGEKYGDVVRVVSVPGFSMELCGGSHVSNIGQIGLFKIVSETGVAAGVRRIEAITGKAALEYANNKARIVAEAAAKLKCHDDELVAHVESLTAQNKELQKQLDSINAEKAKEDAAALTDKAEKIGDISVIAAAVDASDMDDLRNIADMTCEKLTDGIVVLGTVNGDKVNLVVKASKSAVSKGAHSGKIIKEAAAVVGGGGGGRPDMAQAGGKQPAKLKDALAKAVEVIRSQLG